MTIDNGTNFCLRGIVITTMIGAPISFLATAVTKDITWAFIGIINLNIGYFIYHLTRPFDRKPQRGKRS